MFSFNCHFTFTLTGQQVDRLESIFRDRFRFEIQKFRIPSSKSDTALLNTVSRFAQFTSGHSQSFDCSRAEAFLGDGTKLPVNVATGKVAPQSPISDGTLAPSQSPSLKLHNFLNLFSVAWALDLSQVNNISPWSWSASVITARSHHTRGIEQAHGLSYLKPRKFSLPSSRHKSIAGHERLMWVAIILGIFLILITMRTVWHSRGRAVKSYSRALRLMMYRLWEGEDFYLRARDPGAHVEKKRWWRCITKISGSPRLVDAQCCTIIRPIVQPIKEKRMSGLSVVQRELAFVPNIVYEWHGTILTNYLHRKKYPSGGHKEH